MVADRRWWCIAVGWIVIGWRWDSRLCCQVSVGVTLMMLWMEEGVAVLPTITIERCMISSHWSPHPPVIILLTFIHHAIITSGSKLIVYCICYCTANNLVRDKFQQLHT